MLKSILFNNACLFECKMRLRVSFKTINIYIIKNENPLNTFVCLEQIQNNKTLILDYKRK